MCHGEQTALWHHSASSVVRRRDFPSSSQPHFGCWLDNVATSQQHARQRLPQEDVQGLASICQPPRGAFARFADGTPDNHAPITGHGRLHRHHPSHRGPCRADPATKLALCRSSAAASSSWTSAAGSLVYSHMGPSFAKCTRSWGGSTAAPSSRWHDSGGSVAQFRLRFIRWPVDKGCHIMCCTLCIYHNACAVSLLK